MKKKDDLLYNKPFTDRELKTAIRQKNTAPGKDTIYSQMMIKRLLSETCIIESRKREKYQKLGNTKITLMPKTQKMLGVIDQ